MKAPNWRRVWLVWVVGTVGYFAVFETWAIIDKAASDTLSEQVWRLLAYPAFSVPFTILWFGGLVWLTVHFFKRAKW